MWSRRAPRRRGRGVRGRGAAGRGLHGEARHLRERRGPRAAGAARRGAARQGARGLEDPAVSACPVERSSTYNEIRLDSIFILENEEGKLLN